LFQELENKNEDQQENKNEDQQENKNEDQQENKNEDQQENTPERVLLSGYKGRSKPSVICGTNQRSTMYNLPSSSSSIPRG